MKTFQFVFVYGSATPGSVGTQTFNIVSDNPRKATVLAWEKLNNSFAEYTCNSLTMTQL